jgi:ribosomal protein S18 acetylase RimI-like enzyme
MLIKDMGYNMTLRTVFTNEKNENFIILAKKLWDEYVEISGDVVKQYQKFNTLEGKHFVILICDGEKAIACGSFKRFSKDTAEIRRVYVEKQHRRRKLASYIMENLEKIAKEKGYDNIVLETGVKNKVSRKFYKNLDYNIIANFEPFKDMSTCLCLKKKL